MLHGQSYLLPCVRIDVCNRETLPRICRIGGRGRKAGGDVSAVKGNDLGWGSRHCVSIDYRNIIVQGIGRYVDCTRNRLSSFAADVTTVALDGGVFKQSSAEAVAANAKFGAVSTTGAADAARNKALLDGTTSVDLLELFLYCEYRLRSLFHLKL